MVLIYARVVRVRDPRQRVSARLSVTEDSEAVDGETHARVSRDTEQRDVVIVASVVTSAAHNDEDDGEPKKTPRATMIRRGLVVALVLLCAGGWMYTRYGVKKGTLGDKCSYDMHCRSEAPRCLKSEGTGGVDAEGVCSRSCDKDADCAEGIACVKVELEDRDEKGRPLEGGYCFPKSIIEARKQRKRGDAGSGAPTTPTTPTTKESWLEIPNVTGQLEGTITVRRGAIEQAFIVKGTLIRPVMVAGKRRMIMDTSTLRVYTVEDDRKAFSASQMSAGPDAKLTKTDRKDRLMGHECEIWQIEDDQKKKTLEACVLHGGAFVDPTGRMASSWEKELAVRSAFAIRVNEGDVSRLIATKIDLHPVDASDFVIPKTYRNLAAH